MRARESPKFGAAARSWTAESRSIPSGRRSIAIHHPQTRINNGCLFDRANSSPRRGDNHAHVWLRAPGIIGLIATSAYDNVFPSATKPTVILDGFAKERQSVIRQGYRDIFERDNSTTHRSTRSMSHVSHTDIVIVFTLSDRHSKRVHRDRCKYCNTEEYSQYFPVGK